jgi:hypothetical protein
MIRSKIASTTKVYGRLSAIRTSAIINQAFLAPAKCGEEWLPRANSFAPI